MNDVMIWWWLLGVAGMSLALAVACAPGHLRTRAAERAREARRHRREVALEAAGIPRGELCELTDLVEQLGAIVPDEANRLELEALLDEYARLAVLRRTAGERLARIERSRPLSALLPPPSQQRSEILSRRDRQRAHAAERLAELDDRAGELAQLVRHYAERAAMPEIDYLLDDDPLGSRLSLLEEA